MKSTDSNSRPLFRPRLLEIFQGKAPNFRIGNEVMAGLAVGLIALPLAIALGVASIPLGV